MQNEQEINKEELTNTENATEQAENEKKASSDAESTSDGSSNEKAFKDELTEVKDKYLRLYSEFENFRRRTAKEKLEMVQSANEQLIRSLLPVADDFERAEKSFSASTNGSDKEKEREGFLLIHNKFKKVLEQYGAKPMDIQPGSDFSADTQEAIAQTSVSEEKLKGKVVDVVEKGYLLNEKVIRFAKVVVGN